ncbi:GNAT family N-acetyltransferase [Ereboglobus sp. PH5-5]|uniref:GNAT family N-acetyltransferase n=1 Tax=Ereboglobus sp. PH5-5 TaxID=2940529 RepID=UPI002407425F|nr:GNAT family N-acetyltransferase [Ereboglobus sp. PH5-5]
MVDLLLHVGGTAGRVRRDTNESANFGLYNHKDCEIGRAGGLVKSCEKRARRKMTKQWQPLHANTLTTRNDLETFIEKQKPQMEIETNSVTLVDYRDAEHAGRLSSWLRRPHVVQWWGETSLDEATSTKSNGGSRIILIDKMLAEYVHWHVLDRAELDEAGLNDIPEGGIDLDILIGETAFLQKGVGAQALRLTVDFLRHKYRPRFFSMCTQIENARAIACYRKVGFVIVRTFKENGRAYYFLRGF